VNAKGLKFGNMTTYAQALVANADRKRKKEVRDFLFSFYTDMQLNKIVGLAGPHIQDYINFCKSKGYTEFEIYEKDGLTAMHQLIQLKDSVQLKLKDILEANPNEPGTLYDLDYCVTVRHMKEHIAKFKNNFIMTFARRVPLTETIGTFFTVRDEHVIKTYVYDNPINHTMYHTNKGKYIYAPYKDTSPMCCFAKIA
jgi:hypothetical protein